MSSSGTYFECKHCLKKFISERYYNKHECEQMKRFKLLGTNRGSIAYSCYCSWATHKGYRKPTVDHFIDSRKFKAFFRFIEFSNKMALPARDRYIEYMTSLGINPVDWTKKIVYEHYITEFDNIFSPEDQAAITVDTVFELARIYECETDDIFTYMEANTLLQLVQAKKLSPWVLLFSNKFISFIQNDMTREQRIMLKTNMDITSWEVIFKKSVKTAKKMQTYVNALGI
jgi:hypothetical protein